MIRAASRAAALAMLYAILVVWLTWPLATHLTTHHPRMRVGSDFDSLYSAWVLAWESHALATPGVHFVNANIYYPAPDALFYGPVAFGALPFFAPIYWLTGNPVLALNLVFLASIALTAALLHFVVFLWTRMHGAGAVAAVAFLANRWLLMSFVPGVPHVSVLFYFPLIILLSSSPHLTWRRCALLALLVAAQGLTDPLSIAPAVFAPLSLLAAFRLARRHTRTQGLRLSGALALAALALVAIHAPYLSITRNNPELAQQTLWNLDPNKISLDLPLGLMGMVSPLAIASLVPLLVLVGAAFAAFDRDVAPREITGWRHSALWALTGIAISLPGHVSVLGHTYQLPHLQWAQSSNSLARLLLHSERLRVAALMGIALLAGLAFAAIARRCRLTSADGPARRVAGAGLAAVLCAAFYAQYQSTIGQPFVYGPPLAGPYPGGEVPRDSPVLRELRHRDGVVVEVPLNLIRPTHQTANATAMYRSVYHWQPLVNGYSSYWPRGFPERMRLAAALPNANAIRELRRQAGLSFVLVSKDSAQATGPRMQQWFEIARHGGRHDISLIAEDDTLMLFQVSR